LPGLPLCLRLAALALGALGGLQLLLPPGLRALGLALGLGLLLGALLGALLFGLFVFRHDTLPGYFTDGRATLGIHSPFGFDLFPSSMNSPFCPAPSPQLLSVTDWRTGFHCLIAAVQVLCDHQFQSVMHGSSSRQAEAIWCAALSGSSLPSHQAIH